MCLVAPVVERRGNGHRDRPGGGTGPRRREPAHLHLLHRLGDSLALHRQRACHPQILPAPSLCGCHPIGCRPPAAPVCGTIHHLRDAEEPEGDQEGPVRGRQG